MSLVDILGWACVLVGTGFSLPQFIRLMRSRTSAGLSLLAWQLNAAIGLAWMFYGIRTHQAVLIVPNAILAVTSLAILTMIRRDRGLGWMEVVMPAIAIAAVAVNVLLLGGPALFGIFMVIPQGIGAGGQLVDLIRSPDVRGVSGGYLWLYFGLQMMWLLYGFLKNDRAMIIASAITGALMGANVIVFHLRRAGVLRAAPGFLGGNRRVPAEELLPHNWIPEERELAFEEEARLAQERELVAAGHREPMAEGRQNRWVHADARDGAPRGADGPLDDIPTTRWRQPGSFNPYEEGSHPAGERRPEAEGAIAQGYAGRPDPERGQYEDRAGRGQRPYDEREGQPAGSRASAARFDEREPQADRYGREAHGAGQGRGYVDPQEDWQAQERYDGREEADFFGARSSRAATGYAAEPPRQWQPLGTGGGYDPRLAPAPDPAPAYRGRGEMEEPYGQGDYEAPARAGQRSASAARESASYPSASYGSASRPSGAGSYGSASYASAASYGSAAPLADTGAGMRPVAPASYRDEQRHDPRQGSYSSATHSWDDGLVDSGYSTGRVQQRSGDDPYGSRADAGGGEYGAARRGAGEQYSSLPGYPVGTSQASASYRAGSYGSASYGSDPYGRASDGPRESGSYGSASYSSAASERSASYGSAAPQASASYRSAASYESAASYGSASYPGSDAYGASLEDTSGRGMRFDNVTPLGQDGWQGRSDGYGRRGGEGRGGAGPYDGQRPGLRPVASEWDEADPMEDIPTNRWRPTAGEPTSQRSARRAMPDDGWAAR